ncbi:uncharacterized protein CBL_02496 [Carabus blaptoides fortunei]
MSEKTDLEKEIENLSHEDLCEITLSTLRRLLASDPLLSDLPADVTIEEVNSQIAVAQGQSITVQILRSSDTPLNVVIPQGCCTVRDLKKAIQRAFELKQQRSRSRSKISWIYIWKTYYLQHDSVVMRDDQELVSAYGVVNKAQIRFVKRLRKSDRGRLVLLVLLDILCVVSCVEYPWYEQISRQELLTSNCDALGLTTTLTSSSVAQLDHILVDHNHKLLYCYVPKVACTNWKRVMMVLTGRYNTTDLVQIPASLVHANGSLPKLSQLNENEVMQCLNNYTRFIVVRHPFERLLSAYRNKLEDHYPSAKYFQARIGRYIVKKYRSKPSQKSLALGDDVSFREFVQYLISEGMNKETVNEHWQPIYDMCHPCAINYTFIAKYERLVEDAEMLLNMIQAPYILFPQSRPSSTYKKLRMYFSQLSLHEMDKLYHLYKVDFKLFGYDLEDILGYDIG